jgi:hypothetical protein
MLQPTGTIMQIAYVVQDIATGAARWTAATGAGPFFVLPHLEVLNLRYRGRPVNTDCSIALGFSGGVCVELIQQHDEAPSVFRELLARSGPGFHHWGFMTGDFDAELARHEAAGREIAFSGTVAVGARFAYVDTVDALGGMMELIEVTPPVAALFQSLEDSARNWNGRDPLRTLPRAT